MNPILKGKLRLLTELTLIGAFAGIIYQLLDAGYVSYKAILMGAPIGFAFGVMELFLQSGLKQRLIKLPLIISILIKSVGYVTVIYIISGTIGLIVGLSEGKNMQDFYASLVERDQFILIIYSLVTYVLMSFYIQINLLLGQGVLLKFLKGKYRTPTKEHRIFMFLDVKSSTTLAEKLGHEKYYALLNDFFHEISKPVLNTKAEIYQYVGDEVVITWKTPDGLLNMNCIDIFFQVKQNVADRSGYYEKKYGVVPEFKAGLHFGEVISAQIGDIKREIVYNGDVLNTAARIQEQCNKLKRELLISGALLSEMEISKTYQSEKMTTITLRGKERANELFSLERI